MGESETAAARSPVGPMHKRRTTLADGRYLIYYTFGEEDESRAAGGSAPAVPGPEAEPEAEEERRV